MIYPPSIHISHQIQTPVTLELLSNYSLLSIHTIQCHNTTFSNDIDSHFFLSKLIYPSHKNIFNLIASNKLHHIIYIPVSAYISQNIYTKIIQHKKKRGSKKKYMQHKNGRLKFLKLYRVV